MDKRNSVSEKPKKNVRYCRYQENVPLNIPIVNAWIHLIEAKSIENGTQDHVYLKIEVQNVDMEKIVPSSILNMLPMNLMMSRKRWKTCYK